MKKEARDYLNTEYNYFRKAYEIQFTHFMGVFYFWTAVVTAPVAAGLLSSKDNLNSPAFPILLGLIAFIGLFLSAKMFDIRCSQLKYILLMNQVRAALYFDIQADLPKNYKLPFPSSKDLRIVALTDFGMMMAITMSLLDAILFGFAALPLLLRSTGFSWWAFGIYWLVGMLIYVMFVLRKVPKPSNDHERKDSKS
jgi:hypothetical protein